MIWRPKVAPPSPDEAPESCILPLMGNAGYAYVIIYGMSEFVNMSGWAFPPRLENLFVDLVV